MPVQPVFLPAENMTENAAAQHPYTTLISVQDLSEFLTSCEAIDTGALVVLDVRHDLTDSAAGLTAFAAGHIPFAQFLHLDHDLSGEKKRADGSFAGRHPLPERDVLAERLAACGVSRTTQVVVYDAHGGMFAARVWWMLHWLGHSRVAVLDGGLPAWQQAGHALSQETYDAVRGNLRPGEPLAHTVSMQDIASWLESDSETRHPQVVDARAPDRFRGENETLDATGGHIPGARNRFFKDNLGPDGRFKPGTQLRSEWQAVLGDANAAVMQCGSGVTACHNLLALELAGLPQAALYPGSWSEWSATPGLPVATGPG